VALGLVKDLEADFLGLIIPREILLTLGFLSRNFKSFFAWSIYVECGEENFDIVKLCSYL
jgi:hypothetical protein